MTATCEEDEIAVGCETTGFNGCGASQVFDAKGCKVDKCGDFPHTPWQGTLRAVCCKRGAVQIS